MRPEETQDDGPGWKTEGRGREETKQGAKVWREIQQRATAGL